MTPEELKQLQTIVNGMGSEAKASLPNTINGIWRLRRFNCGWT